MEVIGAILLLLVVARLFGALAGRVGAPPAVGEMLAGIVIITALRMADPGQGLADDLAHNEALERVADLGIFFLLLMAGVEMQLSREQSTDVFKTANLTAFMPPSPCPVWAPSMEQTSRSSTRRSSRACDKPLTHPWSGVSHRVTAKEDP